MYVSCVNLSVCGSLNKCASVTPAFECVYTSAYLSEHCVNLFSRTLDLAPVSVLYSSVAQNTSTKKWWIGERPWGSGHLGSHPSSFTDFSLRQISFFVSLFISILSDLWDKEHLCISVSAGTSRCYWKLINNNILCL